MNSRWFLRKGTLLAVAALLAAGCESGVPTATTESSLHGITGSSVGVLTTVYASGSVPVTAWDPIFPSAAYPSWQSQCSATPTVGLNASWQNPHPATAFPLGTHPWEFTPPMNFSAQWINAWSNISSQGPAGQSWTKYSTPVSGQGDFVVQFLADNCSWIYLDNTLIGVQTENWATGTGRYPLTLAGDHTLTFVIWDGGGAAGGKFRLETLQSFIDNGGDPGTLPSPADNTPPTITPTVTGTLGSNGWYTSDVDVSWTIADAQSAVTSTSGCGTSTVSGDTPGAPFTCSATSAGGTASESATVKRDATVPSVGFSGNLGSYTVDQQVAITCSASDAMSGLASSTCPNASGDAYTFGVGAHTLSASATDNAGSASSATAQFTVQVTRGSLCALVQRWVSQRRHDDDHDEDDDDDDDDDDEDERDGIARSMCQQLRNGAYRAFRRHVSAQSGKSVSAAHAAVLIALSKEL